jgi:hypothetical protein
MNTTAPAGWYADPQGPETQRYWDGGQWTAHVRRPPLLDVTLDSAVAGEYTKKPPAIPRQLVILPEELWWGDQHVRWDEVTGCRSRIVYRNNHAIRFEAALERGAEFPLAIVYAQWRKGEAEAKQVLNFIIEQVRQTVAPRVLEHLLGRMDAGEPVRVSGLRLSPEGFQHEGKSDRVPWTEYGGVKVGKGFEIFVQIFRAKPGGGKKRACRVEVDMLRSWVLPPLIEEHARRFGGPFQH